MQLQTNNVQATLLQSESVSEINFPAIWRHEIKKKITLVPILRALHGDSYLIKQ